MPSPPEGSKGKGKKGKGKKGKDKKGDTFYYVPPISVDRVIGVLNVVKTLRNRAEAMRDEMDHIIIEANTAETTLEQLVWGL